jgi:heat shock protein HtpX
VYEQIAANKRKTFLIFAGFIILLLAVGWTINYLIQGGVVFGAVIAIFVIGSSIFSYYKSDAIALRVSRAVPADPTQYARYYNLVEGLTIASGLPMPRLYIVNDDAPNAFATGRNPKHAAVAVTTGLLEKMNRVELEGVLAHELSHIKNYDILIMTISVTLVGVVVLLSDVLLRAMFWGGGRRDGDGNGNGGSPVAAILAIFGFLLIILSPLIARLMQFAVSRKREYLADASGVQLTRYPPGLISALKKLEDDKTSVQTSSKATAHLWIEEPLDKESNRGQNKFNRLFDTHPPIGDRIHALEQM